MSEEATPSPEAVETEVTPKPVRAKRAPKKTAASKRVAAEAPPAEPGPAAGTENIANVNAVADAHAIEVPLIQDPDQGGESSSSAKRKRRRRKGKGGSSHGGDSSEREESSATRAAAPGSEGSPKTAASAGQSHAPRQRPDSDLLAKKAWKIFLAEISEEGVALIGDHEAKELSRRCFRLAEIFLEERSRRRG